MRRSLSIGGLVSVQLLAVIATQLTVIRVVGVGAETDAYVAAQTAPAILTAIIVTALQSVWLPRLSVLIDDITAWKKEQSIAQGQALLLGLGVFILIYLCLPLLIRYVFPGFTGEQVERVMLFSVPLLLATIFNIQTALLTTALRARNKFVVAELIMMFAAIIAFIAVITMLPNNGLEAVVVINLIRSISVYFLQMSFARWPVPALILGWQCKETWRMMRPLLFGASLYKTSPLVDRYWLSQVQNGGITIYNLAQTIVSMMSTVLERVIAMPLTPMFARYIKDLDYIGLKKAYRKGLYQVTFGVVLIGFLFFFLKSLFVTVIVELLDVQPDIASDIWLLCILLLGYLHVAISGAISVAVFYAFGDTKMPVIIGLFGFFMGVFLKWLWFYFYGINGIAVATSTYFLINISLFYWVIENKINKYGVEL